MWHCKTGHVWGPSVRNLTASSLRKSDSWGAPQGVGEVKSNSEKHQHESSLNFIFCS